MLVILNGADVRDGKRYFTATVDGVRYDIPQAWAERWCVGSPGTDARDAAVAWHEQSLAAQLIGDGGRSNPDRYPENDGILGSRDVSHLEYGGQ
jgi:hypothetical protein